MERVCRALSFLGVFAGNVHVVTGTRVPFNGWVGGLWLSKAAPLICSVMLIW